MTLASITERLMAHIEDTKVAPEPTKQEKVFNLTVELIDTKQRKKDSNKGYNEEINRIQDEIEALLTDDKETEKTND